VRDFNICKLTAVSFLLICLDCVTSVCFNKLGYLLIHATENRPDSKSNDVRLYAIISTDFCLPRDVSTEWTGVHMSAPFFCQTSLPTLMKMVRVFTGVGHVWSLTRQNCKLRRTRRWFRCTHESSSSHSCSKLRSARSPCDVPAVYIYSLRYFIGCVCQLFTNNDYE